VSTLTPADFFLLRTPLLPSETLRDWGAGLESATVLAEGGDLEAATRRDLARVRARLREIVAQPGVRAAIQVASPSLSERLGPWLAGEETEAALAVEPAIVRYVARMAGRATPFGLFAGCAYGRAAEKTNLWVSERSAQHRRSRVSLDWILALVIRLVDSPEIRSQLRYRLNTSLYRIGSRWRFYAIRLDDGKTVKHNARSYPLRDFITTPFAEVAFGAARGRDDLTIRDLAEAIVTAHPAVGLDDAARYVDDLVKAQLFWPSILPGVTGEDPLPRIAAVLREIPAASETADLLDSMLGDLCAADAAGPGAISPAAARLVETATRIAPEADTTNLVRVDLCKPSTEVTLGHDVLREIARGVELLAKLTPPQESPVTEFARKFQERYEGREVPLLEALDPDYGIGFEQAQGADPSPLIKGLALGKREDASRAWRDRDEHLLAKLLDAATTGQTSIELSDEDVKRLSGERAPPPAGQTAIVAITASSADALLAGDYQISLVGASYSTAASLLGRFLQNDSALCASMVRFVRAEDARREEAVHAEIAHHNEGFGTNLACRPLLRDYEIDVLGGSGAPIERRIPLSDLLISVRDGQVVLRSASLGRRVIPLLSNAHYFGGKGFSAYRLLAFLQRSGVHANVDWSWGPLRRAAFLPRVTYGRFVLQPAVWHVETDRITALASRAGASRFRALEALRAALKLPRHVSLVDGDNVLPLDLHNPLSVESLLGLCKGRPRLQFVETLGAEGPQIAAGPEGTFHHEIFVPILRRSPERPASPASTPLAPRATPAGHSKAPGSDWLFAKLYCGMTSAEAILCNTVAPLVRRLREERLVERWFFVRYSDPGLHLRLRFQGDPATLWTRVAPRLLEALSASSSLVHRTTLDTYELEIERYGGEKAMAIAHEVFAADSDAALDVIRSCGSDPEARWRLALYGMNDLLAVLGFDMSKRRAIVSSARDEWFSSLHGNANVSHRLGAKFREARRDLESLLEKPAERYARGIEAYRRRASALETVGRRLRELDHAGDLVAPMDRVVKSYLHMSANRIFRGSQNQHELVVYDLLSRLYEGALARSRRAGESRRASGTDG
jgi:thiopeptide-type bacteriocin biosynthesis protein